MKLKPLNGRIVVKGMEPVESAGGLLFPSREKKSTGEIISMSPDSIHTALNVGMKVIFNPEHASEVEVDGETVYILHEKQIFGYIDENNN